jgi:hypothetical protein
VYSIHSSSLRGAYNAAELEVVLELALPVRSNLYKFGGCARVSSGSSWMGVRVE